MNKEILFGFLFYGYCLTFFYSYVLTFFKKGLMLSILPWPAIISNLSILVLCSWTLIGLKLISFHEILNLVAFLLVIIFNIINLYRLIIFKEKEKYLKKSYILNLVYLFIFEILITLCLFFNISLFLYLGLLLALIVFYSLLRNYLKLYNKKIAPRVYLSDQKLPSITVAIPARNEDQELITCLDSLLKSDYPKLEVLVLDDCSNTPKTAQIIRQFSHDGVTFVQGNSPPEDYLAKNYAYQQLHQASNGEYIIFMGVDTLVKPNTLRIALEFALSNKKEMLSVLPINIYANSKSLSKIPQTLRYLFELTIPRRLIHKPSVLSTFWLIKKDILKQFGGFKGIKKDILPERAIANFVLKSNLGYSFILANQDFYVASHKDYKEQLNTAIRVKYPSLHRKIYLVLLVVLAELSIFIFPVIGLIIGLFQYNLMVIIVSFLTILFSSISYYILFKITTRKNYYLSLIIFFGVGLLDIYLWFRSIFGYEFGEVIWKERNVCLPIRY